MLLLAEVLSVSLRGLSTTNTVYTKLQIELIEVLLSCWCQTSVNLTKQAQAFLLHTWHLLCLLVFQKINKI